MKEFWTAYIKGDEIERRNLLKSIPIIRVNGDGLLEYFSLTLFQSYLDDLIEFMKE